MTASATDRAPGTATLEPRTRPHRTGPSWVRIWPRLLTLVALTATLVRAGCSTTTTASSSGPTSGLDVKPSAVALQQQFVQVVKQVGPSVVLIQTSEGLGSGIVFDARGDVVTNHHVVDNADAFRVTLANGRQYRARLVGSFPADDLAVLHIDAGGLPPAAGAGIRAGELITAVDGTATPDPATLTDVLAGLDPGQAVTVALARPDEAGHTVRVTLGQFPG